MRLAVAPIQKSRKIKVCHDFSGLAVLLSVLVGRHRLIVGYYRLSA